MAFASSACEDISTDREAELSNNGPISFAYTPEGRRIAEQFILLFFLVINLYNIN